MAHLGVAGLVLALAPLAGCDASAMNPADAGRDACWPQIPMAVRDECSSPQPGCRCTSELEIDCVPRSGDTRFGLQLICIDGVWELSGDTLCGLGGRPGSCRDSPYTAECPCCTPGAQICLTLGVGVSCSLGRWGGFLDGPCGPFRDAGADTGGLDAPDGPFLRPERDAGTDFDADEFDAADAHDGSADAWPSDAGGPDAVAPIDGAA